MFIAASDSSHERSILRTQMVVFGEAETITQRDGVEPSGNRSDNIDGRLQEGGAAFWAKGRGVGGRSKKTHTSMY